MAYKDKYYEDYLKYIKKYTKMGRTRRPVNWDENDNPTDYVEVLTPEHFKREWLRAKSALMDVEQRDEKGNYIDHSNRAATEMVANEYFANRDYVLNRVVELIKEQYPDIQHLDAQSRHNWAYGFVMRNEAEAFALVRSWYPDDVSYDLAISS